MRLPHAGYTTECYFCHEPLDIRDKGINVFVEGWIENRTGGGAHGVRMAKRFRKFACKWCVDKGSSKAGVDQLNLFR